MPKIRIEESESLEVEEILKRKVKPFGTNGGHVTIPKKYVGQETLILVKEAVGQFMSGYKKSVKRLNKKNKSK